MDAFHDYAFVVNGKKRKEVVKLLEEPRTPTELAKALGVHANVITRILKDLTGRGLAESYGISGGRKTYSLTKRGELARQILDNLVAPKTISELMRHLRTHRNVILSVLRQLIQVGFLTLFKTGNQSRKVYRLTRRGEDIREKLGGRE